MRVFSVFVMLSIAGLGMHAKGDYDIARASPILGTWKETGNQTVEVACDQKCNQDKRHQ